MTRAAADLRCECIAAVKRLQHRNCAADPALRLECHCEDSGNAAHCEPCDLEATGNGRSANQGRPERPGPAPFIVQQ